MPALKVQIGSLELRNPLMAASGTCGYGVEIANVVDLSTIGAIVTKGLYMSARDGAEVPRIVETPAGLLNAIGLQGVGIRAFVDKVLPQLRAHDTKVIVNVCGETVDEYAEVSRIASEADGVHGLEVNISCPNVKTGGIAFGTDPVMTHDVVSAVRRATRLPVIPKLSPNVTDITVFARACEDAGADAISCVNTFLGLAIDVESRKPRLAFGTGGLSGPAIRPLAVRMTWQAARAVKIPIIGIGGIASASDALEFFIAGARAVQVGTLNFSRPNIYSDIEAGLIEYLTRHKLADINDLVGTIQYPR
ncbi:MAG: dihydroorotate dehydrogenase [Vicinamibacteria bacterium]